VHFQNHEHFRHLIESSPDPIAIHCEDKLVYINQAGVDLLGLDKEILIGRSRFELTHPDYWDESTEQVNEMLQEGTPSKIREIKLVGKEGQSIEVGIKSAPITYMGKPAIQVIIRDITEQKRVEKAMKESNELVINILESIPDAFFAVNIDWRITYVNQEAEKYIQRGCSNSTLLL
jgi:PAS domain S-box-containing protein